MKKDKNKTSKCKESKLNDCSACADSNKSQKKSKNCTK